MNTRSLLLCALALCCYRDPTLTVLEHAPAFTTDAQLQATTQQFASAGLGQRVVLNRPPAEGEIALLLPHASTDWDALKRINRRIEWIENNCFASPRSRIIACDPRVVENNLPAFLDSTPTQEQRRLFTVWLVGHELGHIAEKSAGAHSETNPQHGPRDLRSQRREYAADCWMLQTLHLTASHEEQVALQAFSMDIINTRVRQIDGEPPAGVGLLFDYNRLDPYDLLGGHTHPDWGLRSLRILHIGAAMRDDPALRALLESFVRRLVPDPLWTERGPCGLS